MSLTICDPASDKVLFTSTYTDNDPSEASFNVPTLMSQFRQQVEASKTSEHRNYPQCFDIISCTDGTRIMDDHFETRTAMIGFGGLSFVLEQQTPIAAQPRINIAREALPNSSTSLSPPITPVDPSGSSKSGKRSSRPWEDGDDDKHEELTCSAGQAMEKKVEDEPHTDETANPHVQQDDWNGPVHKRNSIPSISDMLPSIQSPLSNWNSLNATQLPGLATTFPTATKLTFERGQSTYMEALPQIPSPSTTPQSVAFHPQISSQPSPHYNSGVHVHQPQPQRQQVHYLIQQLNNSDSTTSPNKHAQLPPHIHPAIPPRSSLSRNATYPPPPPLQQQHPTQTKARLVVDSNSPSPIRDDDDGSVLPVSIGKTRPLKDGDCKHCGIKTSREWRKGPHGAKTLCNACGLRYKRKPWDIPTHERAGIHN
ncbi:hypothetical protein HDU80_004163 [Chytriomyces hyalinus]|nr:hypothetical protein HDU80_004163 [Chytriomyces hyalinus]